MNIVNITASTVAVCTFACSTAAGGLVNFLVTNTGGTIYEIDGQTMQANEVSTLDSNANLNEILYEGNYSILYNDSNRIMRHNLLTSQETLVFDTSIGFNDGATVAAGLAHTGNGNLFYSANRIAPGKSAVYAITANPTSQSATTALMDERPTFFDHHMVGNNLFIGATYLHNEIVFTDSNTGVIEDRFSVNIAIVSFFENTEGIFAMTKEGELHSVDLQSRSLSFYGQISGTSGNLIGATVPSPSTLVCIGVLSITGMRRRR